MAGYTTHTKCSYVLPIIFGIVVTLIGFILTMIGNFRKPFFSDSSSSWCEFCKEDTDSTREQNRNMRIAGPVMIGIGVFILIVSCIRCKRYPQEMAQSQAARFSHGQQTATGYQGHTQMAAYSTTGSCQPASGQPTPYGTGQPNNTGIYIPPVNQNPSAYNGNPGTQAQAYYPPPPPLGDGQQYPPPSYGPTTPYPPPQMNTEPTKEMPPPSYQESMSVKPSAPPS